MAATMAELGASPLASAAKSTAAAVRSISLPNATRWEAAIEASTKPSLATAERTLERGGLGPEETGMDECAGAALGGTVGCALAAGGCVSGATGAGAMTCGGAEGLPSV